MDSNNASEAFKLPSKARKRQSPKPVNTKDTKIPKFDPVEINSSSTDKNVGTLEEITEEELVTKVQLHVKEQYTTTFAYISSLVCCKDGSVWISGTGYDKVRNINLSHGSIHVNKSMNLKCPNMALTASGDLLLCTLKGNLRIIPHITGEIKRSKFGVSPLITTCVHVSKGNKIIVGARKSGPDFPAKGPRQVVVMDMTGRHEQVYHHDNQNKPLFTYPYKLTTDKHNTIYVIDLLSKDENGRVVVLGQGGDVRGIYTGHPDVNDTDNFFNPQDIVTTESDNVIVADQDNHTLHILNNNVQCVQYLNTEQSGIKLPTSLFIDNKGFLLIGCNTGENEPENAIIYVVQLETSSL